MTVADLHWLFPHWGIGLMSLAWVAAAFIASTIMNHQSLQSKQLNALKAFGLVALISTWNVISRAYVGEPLDSRPLLLNFSGWLLFEAGDWGAYFVSTLNLSPGGLKGYFWRKVALTLQKASTASAIFANEALHPAEAAIFEAHMRDQLRAEAALVAKITSQGLGQPLPPGISIPPPKPVNVTPPGEPQMLTPQMLDPIPEKPESDPKEGGVLS